MRLKQRLLRLERSGRRRKAQGAPLVDWDALARGELPGPGEDAAAAAERLRRHPAAVVIRREMARLGLPEPVSFEGVNLIEEALRLAGLVTPGGPGVGAAEGRPA